MEHFQFTLKMVFGFGILGSLAGLAVLLAIGDVHPKASSEMHDVIITLQNLAAAFGGWLAGASNGHAQKKEPPAGPLTQGVRPSA